MLSLGKNLLTSADTSAINQVEDFNRRGEKLKNKENENGIMKRRSFLKFCSMTALSSAAPLSLFSRSPANTFPERSLAFYNTHTGEFVKSLFWIEGKFIPDALEEINYILRDHRSDEIKEMDTGLMNLLWKLRKKVGVQKPFHVISGYRSPRTNELLRKRSRGIAKNSLHLYGKAVDIRIPGVKLSSLREAALELKAGGVGFYPKSDFIHIDTGRIRCW